MAEGKERGLRSSPASLHKARLAAPGMRAPRQRSPAGTAGAAPRGLGAAARSRHCAHYITAPAPPPAAPLTCAAVTCTNSSLNRCPGKGDYSAGATWKERWEPAPCTRPHPPAQRLPRWAPLGHRWGIPGHRSAPSAAAALTQISLLAPGQRAGHQPLLSPPR